MYRDWRDRACVMYSNGIKVVDISKELNKKYETVRGFINREYLGVIYSSTPVHVILKSKV